MRSIITHRQLPALEVCAKFAKQIRLPLPPSLYVILCRVAGQEVTLFIQDKEATLGMKVKYHSLASRCNH